MINRWTQKFDMICDALAVSDADFAPLAEPVELKAGHVYESGIDENGQPFVREVADG